MPADTVAAIAYGHQPYRGQPCPASATLDAGADRLCCRSAVQAATPRMTCGGVTLATPGVRYVTEVAVDLAPSDDRTDHRPGSPMTLTVHLAGGRQVVRRIPGTDPALVDRATSAVSGTYSIGTVRTPIAALRNGFAGHGHHYHRWTDNQPIRHPRHRPGNRSAVATGVTPMTCATKARLSSHVGDAECRSLQPWLRVLYM